MKINIKFIIVSCLALFGNLFLFLCVALPAIQNQGYFAGDLDRYGEMKFEFPLIVSCLCGSIAFFFYCMVEVIFKK